MILLALLKSYFTRNEEDLRLMKSIKQKDQFAFSALYEQYSPVVYTMLLRMLKSTAETEDVMQEVFLQIWNKARSFAEEKGSVYTWVMTIARRKAIDRIRTRAGGIPLNTDSVEAATVPDAAYTSNPLTSAISAEYEQFMRNGLAVLGGDERTVIELSYYEGFTQSQIAQQLDMPLGTVKTRMRQGMMTLREYLKTRIEKL